MAAKQNNKHGTEIVCSYKTSEPPLTPCDFTWSWWRQQPRSEVVDVKSCPRTAVHAQWWGCAFSIAKCTNGHRLIIRASQASSQGVRRVRVYFSLLLSCVSFRFLSIAWCLKSIHISSVFLGAATVDQLQENLGALSVRFWIAVFSYFCLNVTAWSANLNALAQRTK